MIGRAVRGAVIARRETLSRSPAATIETHSEEWIDRKITIKRTELPLRSKAASRLDHAVKPDRKFLPEMLINVL